MAKLLFLEVLFLAVIFLALPKFSISCCTLFNTPSQQERIPLKPDPITLECSACNTSTKFDCSSNTRNKKRPTDFSVGLETYFDAEALLATDKCSLSELCSTATSPCIFLCATLHYATHLCLSHSYSLHALRCHGIPCTVALSTTPSTSVSTQLVSSCYSTLGLL